VYTDLWIEVEADMVLEEIILTNVIRNHEICIYYISLILIILTLISVL